MQNATLRYGKITILHHTGLKYYDEIRKFTDNFTLATSSETPETVNFVRLAIFEDNNKKLVCRATHQALDEPKLTEKTLKILCKIKKKILNGII